MGAYIHESFTVTHTQSEYHFTLYYYDQAGNLLKTVSPAGVQENTDTTWIKSVEAAKVAGTVMVPSHTLMTNYRYNTLNQVASQQSPDGGMSNFWYDRLGRLAVSQNRKQFPGNQYSYTQYDTIGRITQVGQLTSGTAITPTISRNDSIFQAWLGAATSTANQITVTSYDSGAYAIQPIIGQRNMRNRVSWTALFDTATDLANGGQNAAAATYYSYDILGNVDTLLQDFGGGVRHTDVANPMNTTKNRFKKISYNFDLVSGKVNQVNYQHGHPDAFYHSYLYDAENRITNVQSSIDSINWDNDAFYSYYAHGPLSRTVLGQQQVQGINYAYTLQGWLKAINPVPYTGSGFTLQPDSSGTVVANSAYNLMLDYFNGDFNPISTAAGPDSAVNTTLGSDYRPLYNGNISSMGARIRGLSSPLLYNYQYDQLNRLIHMDAWNRTSTPWSTITKIPDFQESVGYDPNGNIQQYKRNGNSTISLGMDSLNYFYTSGTNKLDHISDSVNSTCTGCGDLTTQSAGNYQYDSIGELIADAQSNIANITWTVYGKIASITKSGDTTIKFTYDAGGHRISKQVIHAGDTLGTWYVRDAQGNILSIYTYGDPSNNAKDLTQTELDVYGSSRLGMWKRSVDVEVKPPAPIVPMPLLGSADTLIFTRGNKLFELTNHLGNVLSTISDKRFGVSTDDSTVNYFNPDVVTANDYYPFGMLQPGRQFAQSNLGGYRYGFNRKEQDNEVKGAGDQIDYGMRVYDPRGGRFLSVDPIARKFPELTPYQYASNSPISGIDLDGLEYYFAANGEFIGRGADPKNMQVRLGQVYGKTPSGNNQVRAVDLSGNLQKQWTVIHNNYAEFHRLAGVLYAEGSSTWQEAAGIYSVLENRATLEHTDVSQQAQFSKGVYGAAPAESAKIDKKFADAELKQNAYHGLITGILSTEDYSKGAFYWDGKDFNGKNKVRGGYFERYKKGFEFINKADDLWNQGDYKKPGSTRFGKWDYKFQSTTSQGNTTFSKLTIDWRDAQYPGSGMSDNMGKNKQK
jgi:RHS repeat-associated protein